MNAPLTADPPAAPNPCSAEVAPQSPPVTPAPHIPGWDILRIFAAFAVIWFHLKLPAYNFLYAGLPYFLLIGTAALSLRPKPRPILEFLHKRVQRLLNTWAFWCVIYTPVLYLRIHFHPESNPHLSWLHWCIVGPEIHLWYLPYAFLVAALLWPVLKLTQNWSRTALAVIALLLGLAIFVSSTLLTATQNPALAIPWAEWLYASPTLFLGLALGAFLAAPSPAIRALGRWLFILLGIAIVAAIMWFAPTTPKITSSVSWGIAMIVAGLAASPLFPRHISLLTKLSNLSFGIFLVHPLFIYTAHVVAPRVPDAVIFVPVAIASLAAAALLKRIPYLRNQI